MSDHYSTLGIDRGASADEIKRAYRKMASQHHPDKGGDTATFQNIQQAYDTLSNADKRSQYDNPHPQYNTGNGPGGFQFNAAGGPGGFQFDVGGFNFNDIFGHMFRQHRPGQQTQVFRTQITVSLLDSYNGGSNVLRMQTPTGVKDVNISIPKGVVDGDQVRLNNIIDNAALIVEFKVAPDLRFDRKGNDLYCNQPISVLELIAGTTVEVTTISGKVLSVSIPPKTQPHYQIKVSGQGMPIKGTERYGDQILLLKPFVPDTIDDEIVQSILRSKTKSQ